MINNINISKAEKYALNIIILIDLDNINNNKNEIYKLLNNKK